MSRLNIVRQVEIERSARVMQIEGLFELPPSQRSGLSWSVDFDLPEQWNVGLIVGPSGSGKTTVIREMFSEAIVDDYEWDERKSIVDSFPSEMSIKEITMLLSSVGFSSPPSWLRPFRVLSNGEQFRVHVARVLAENPDLAVLDEFTSVVDRTVAKIASAAIQKTVRRRNQKLIAVSCHDDITEWLEPDWIYMPHVNKFITGRSLRRPEISLTVKRVHHSAWEIFGKHHYLDAGFNKAAYCFVAFWGDTPVALCAVLSFPHATSPGWRFHRLVCLPDYQGVGIGSALADYVGSIFASTNKPVRRTLSHPAVIHAANKSPNWKMIQAPKRNSPGGKSSKKELRKTLAFDRFVASFLYVGPAMSKNEVADLFG